MESGEFNKLYMQFVVRPLQKEGFTLNGKSLYFHNGIRQIALIRGGGRLGTPGTIAHILAFRHGFLRENNDLQIPEIPPRYPGQYPWVYSVEELQASGPAQWRFDPRRLMNLPYGRYRYDCREEDEVIRHLSGVVETLLDRYLPWTAGLDVLSAKEQLEPFF